MRRAFEDFPVGLRLKSLRRAVSAEQIRDFARSYDPQLFHLDDEAARASVFGGLAASGWHTAAMSMRLFVETMDVAGGIIGLAVDELRWPTAVRPGDELEVEIEILEARRSKSRPGQGVLRLRSITTNQRVEVVQSFCATAMVPTRT